MENEMEGAMETGFLYGLVGENYLYDASACCV